MARGLCVAAFLIFFAVQLCAAQNGIKVNGLYLTIHPGVTYSWGVSYPVTLETPVIPPSDSQGWIIRSDGHIESKQYPGIVLDTDGNKPSRSLVIGWAEKIPATTNELWTQNPDGSIESQLAPDFYLTSGVDNGVTYPYVDYVAPTPIIIDPFPLPVPTLPPTTPPTRIPTVPPTAPPTIPPTLPPTRPPTISPTTPPTSVPVITKKVTCTAWGDVHYHSFPGNAFDNQGVGFFVLAKSGPYTITSLTKKCPAQWPGRSCNKAVTLTDGVNTFEFTEGDSFKVNGIKQILGTGGTYTALPGFSVKKNGVGVYTTTFPNGILKYAQVGGNQYANIDITLNPGTPKPTGVCSRTSGKRAFENGQEWGELWRVNTAGETGFTFTNESFDQLDQPEFVQNYQPATTTDTVLRTNAQNYCSVLNGQLGTSCAAYIPNAADFYATCVDDIIATGGPNGLLLGAATVSAFSTKCSELAANAVPPVVIALPADATRTSASGPGLKSEISRSAAYKFAIQARDSNGVDRTNTGSDSFTVTSTPAITFTVTATGTGVYNVGFNTPNVLTTYTIYVKYRGVDSILDSPFTVSVVVTFAPLSTASGSVSGTITAGEVYTVDIQAKSNTGTPRDNTNDVFVPSIAGGFPSISAVTNTGPGTYRFSYSQDQIGASTLSIKLGGVHIFGSPFPALNAIA